MSRSMDLTPTRPAAIAPLGRAIGLRIISPLVFDLALPVLEGRCEIPSITSTNVTRFCAGAEALCIRTAFFSSAIAAVPPLSGSAR